MSGSEDKPWFEVYKGAVLELDPQKLPERIVAAKEAMQLRLKEIQGDTDHHAEREQMEDALSILRTLEREKCSMNRPNQSSEKVRKATFPLGAWPRSPLKS